MLKRTRFGLLRAFAQQHGALKLSASNFDFGHMAETARIANAIFILLGPKSRSHLSIAEALGWKLTMPSTRPRGSLMAVECTAIEAVGDRPAFWFIRAWPAGRDAAITDPQRPLSLADWWNEVVVNGKEGPLTRIEIMRVIRDRDGGAHLDLTITSPAYKAALLHGVGFNFQPSTGAPSQPVEFSIETLVRQIGYEVLKGLEAKAIAVNLEMQQLIAAGTTELFEDISIELPAAPKDDAAGS